MRAILVSIFACGLLCADAQTRPDFSGTWKLNEAQSQATVTGPRGIVFLIRHQEPSFKYSASGIFGYAQPFSESYEFQIDGKGTSEQRVHVRARWEGENLLLQYCKGDTELMTFTHRLSAGGRQMVRQGRLKDGRIVRQVYDRQ
jgi:hypothetical protein